MIVSKTDIEAYINFLEKALDKRIGYNKTQKQEIIKKFSVAGVTNLAKNIEYKLSLKDDFRANMFLEDSEYQRMNIELSETVDALGCSQIELMEQLVSQYIQSPEWNQKKNLDSKQFLKTVKEK